MSRMKCSNGLVGNGVNKKELIEGRPFVISNKYSNNVYKLQLDKEREPKHQGCIISGFSFKGEEPKFYSWECNVSKLGTRSLTVYNFVMGKGFKTKYNFRDLKWFTPTKDDSK